MEMHELRVFKAVAQYQGFRKAAEHLYISQSAVSQSLANLERKLGVQLLDRKLPPALTEAGKRVLQHANMVLKEHDAVLEDIGNMKSGLFATLSLATNNFVAVHYCPQLLAEYLKQMPLSRLKVESLPSREIIQAVEQGRWEIGFGPFQRSMAQFETIPLFEENRILVAGAANPHLELLRSRPLQALQELPLITSWLDPAERRPAGKRLRDNFRSVWEINNAALRIALVARGLGVSYVEEERLNENPLCRDFERLPGVDFGLIHRRIGLYYKKGGYLSDAARVFIELCRHTWAKQT